MCIKKRIQEHKYKNRGEIKMYKSENRWESNTHTHTQYNLIKKELIGTIHFEYFYNARYG